MLNENLFANCANTTSPAKIGHNHKQHTTPARHANHEQTNHSTARKSAVHTPALNTCLHNAHMRQGPEINADTENARRSTPAHEQSTKLRG